MFLRAVLVAIAIPIFTTQLHKSKDATDEANIRSYYAELQSEALLDGVDSSKCKTYAAGQTIPLSGTNGVKLNNLSVTIAANSSGDGYVFTISCPNNDIDVTSLGGDISSGT